MEVSLEIKMGQKMDFFVFVLQHVTFPLNEENKIGDMLSCEHSDFGYAVLVDVLRLQQYKLRIKQWKVRVRYL